MTEEYTEEAEVDSVDDDDDYEEVEEVEVDTDDGKVDWWGSPSSFW